MVKKKWKKKMKFGGKIYTLHVMRKTKMDAVSYKNWLKRQNKFLRHGLTMYNARVVKSERGKYDPYNPDNKLKYAVYTRGKTKR